MNIIVEWGNAAHTLLIQQYPVQWDLNDLLASRQAVFACMDTVDHPVDMIIDLRESPRLPPSFLPYMRRMNEQPHPRTRQVAFVGANGFIIAMINMAQRLYYVPHPKPILFARTLEEAIAKISNGVAV